MLKDVIRDGSEVHNIEEERNVGVALVTAVTGELARIDLAHVHKRKQGPNQLLGLHIRRAYHSNSRSSIRSVARFLLWSVGRIGRNVNFLGRDCRRSNEVSDCQLPRAGRSTVGHQF